MSIVELTEYRQHTQGGYTVTVQRTRCANCAAAIERLKPLVATVRTNWYHDTTGRAICSLPADTSKVATPR